MDVFWHGRGEWLSHSDLLAKVMEYFRVGMPSWFAIRGPNPLRIIDWVSGKMCSGRTKCSSFPTSGPVSKDL